MRRPGARSRWASGSRRTASPPRRGWQTTSSSTEAAPSPSRRSTCPRTARGSCSRSRCCPAALALSVGDELDHAHRRLLDREVRYVEHRATEAAVDGARLVELLVDVQQARVALVRPSHRRDAVRPDLREALRVDRQPDDLGGVDLEQWARRVDALDDRDVRRLVTEIAEVDRQRRLRGARDADEHDVRLVEAASDAVVVLDRELDRLDPLEVRLVE